MPTPLLESFVLEIKTADDCEASADSLWLILHAALSQFGFKGQGWETANARRHEFFETKSEVIDHSSGQVLEVFAGIDLSYRNDGWSCVLTGLSEGYACPTVAVSTFATSIIRKARATPDSPYTYCEQHYDAEKNLDDDRILLAEATSAELCDFQPFAETFAAVLSEALSA